MLDERRKVERHARDRRSRIGTRQMQQIVDESLKVAHLLQNAFVGRRYVGGGWVITVDL